MAKGFYLKISLKQKHFAHIQTDKKKKLKKKSAFSLVYIKFLNNHLLSVTTIEKQTKKQNK